MYVTSEIERNLGEKVACMLEGIGHHAQKSITEAVVKVISQHFRRYLDEIIEQVRADSGQEGVDQISAKDYLNQWWKTVTEASVVEILDDVQTMSKNIVADLDNDENTVWGLFDIAIDAASSGLTKKAYEIAHQALTEVTRNPASLTNGKDSTRTIRRLRKAGLKMASVALQEQVREFQSLQETEEDAIRVSVRHHDLNEQTDPDDERKQNIRNVIASLESQGRTELVSTLSSLLDEE